MGGSTGKRPLVCTCLTPGWKKHLSENPPSFRFSLVSAVQFHLMADLLHFENNEMFLRSFEPNWGGGGITNKRMDAVVHKK